MNRYFELLKWLNENHLNVILDWWEYLDGEEE